MYLRLSIAIILCLLSGCATKTAAISTGTQYENQYTGSPCVDGVLLNVKSAGCERAAIYTVPMSRTTRIQCVEKSSESEWTMYSFYFIPDGDEFTKYGMKFLCSDPLFMVTFVEE